MSARKKKIYILVVALGLAALLVDRMLIPGPTEAAAASSATPPASSGTGAGSSADGAGSASAIEPEGFPGSFPAPDGLALSRNAFAPSSDVQLVLLRSAKPDPKSGESGRVVKDPRTSAEAFVARHTLGAVMQGGEVSFVIVDGRRLGPGDSIDECKLVTITGLTARFECFDGAAVLSIPCNPRP